MVYFKHYFKLWQPNQIMWEMYLWGIVNLILKLANELIGSYISAHVLLNF